MYECFRLCSLSLIDFYANSDLRFSIDEQVCVVVVVKYLNLAIFSVDWNLLHGLVLWFAHLMRVNILRFTLLMRGLRLI